MHDADAQQVLTWYTMRWAIEVTFHDSKQHLGFEQPQGWTPKAAQRPAPIAMLLYTLIILWFDRHGRHRYKPIDRPWYRSKTHPPQLRRHARDAQTGQRAAGGFSNPAGRPR